MFILCRICAAAEGKANIKTTQVAEREILSFMPFICSPSRTFYLLINHRDFEIVPDSFVSAVLNVRLNPGPFILSQQQTDFNK